MKYSKMIATLKKVGVKSNDNLKLIKEKLIVVGCEHVYDVVRKNWDYDRNYYDDMELHPSKDTVEIPVNYQFKDNRPRCCDRPIVDGEVCPYCKQSINENHNNRFLNAAKKQKGSKVRKIQVTDAQVEKEMKNIHDYIPY